MIFSVVMPYHENPVMLTHHYTHVRSLPDEIRSCMELRVCDDASALPIPLPVGLADTVRLFRIPGPHIPWSHRVATNIAASDARGRWLIVTDIDHVVPYVTWRFLINTEPLLRADRAYTFTRLNADMSDYKPHPDSWLFHTSLWRQIGGYDERYRGHYGQNFPFVERVRKNAVIEQLPTPLIRYSRDDIADASERVLTRKGNGDKEWIHSKRRELIREGTYFANTQGTQEYERVYP